LGQPPTLINHLVSVAIDRLGTASIAELARDLEIENLPASSTSTTGSASRRQVEDLITVMLNDACIKDSIILAMKSERMMQLDCALLVSEGHLSFLSNLYWVGKEEGINEPSLAERVVCYPVKPLLQMDGLWILQHMEGILEACSKNTLPEATKLIIPLEEKIEASRSTIHRFVRPISGVMAPSLGRAIQIHYQALDTRRQAAIALAVRLYVLDHGRQPEKISDLVPDYLVSVPVNPMSKVSAKYTFGDLAFDLLEDDTEFEEASKKTGQAGEQEE